MKKLATIVLLGLAMWLSSCASNTVAVPPRTGFGGNWETQLTGGVGQTALLDFVSNFSVGLDETTLQINSFSFYNTNTCFNTSLNLQGSEHGTAIITTSASNQVTGTLVYTIQGGGPAGTLLSLQSDSPSGLTGMSSNSVLTNGVVTGTWTMTSSDSDCDMPAPGGRFVMCQETAPNGTGGCGATVAAVQEPKTAKVN